MSRQAPDIHYPEGRSIRRLVVLGCGTESQVINYEIRSLRRFRPEIRLDIVVFCLFKFSTYDSNSELGVSPGEIFLLTDTAFPIERLAKKAGGVSFPPMAETEVRTSWAVERPTFLIW